VLQERKKAIQKAIVGKTNGHYIHTVLTLCMVLHPYSSEAWGENSFH